MKMSKIPFKNDGSFMELFKQMQAEQERVSIEKPVIPNVVKVENTDEFESKQCKTESETVPYFQLFPMIPRFWWQSNRWSYVFLVCPTVSAKQK